GETRPPRSGRPTPQGPAGDARTMRPSLLRPGLSTPVYVGGAGPGARTRRTAAAGRRSAEPGRRLAASQCRRDDLLEVGPATSGIRPSDRRTMSQAQHADASGDAGTAVESSGVSAVPTPPESLVPGVIDLVGVLAYGELSAFDQMAQDARHAPTLAGRTALSQMAAAEMGHFRMLSAYLEQAGVDVEDAMRPVVRPIEAFHDSTAPHSWLESLVKAHVGDGLAADLYREVAEWLDPASR